jgi:hypothetical protein
MKTKSFLSVVLLFAAATMSAQVFYTADGALSSNRTVTTASYFLNFTPSAAAPGTNNLWFQSGRVGIGTNSPAFSLHVNNGDIKASGRLLCGPDFTVWNEGAQPWGVKAASGGIIVRGKDNQSNQTLGWNPTPSIDIQNLANGNLIQLAMSPSNGAYSANALANDVILRGNTPGSLIMTNEGAGALKFATRENTVAGTMPKVQMMIDKMGNVGIGTGSTALAVNEKLAVNGLIHAKEIKVDLLSWPDYVFDKEYDLPTLAEVAKSIAANGHLPNVPSAKEIETSGLELGKLTKIQQEKIEELTLYLIEQDKVNQKQTQEIETLKAMVTQLLDKK